MTISEEQVDDFRGHLVAALDRYRRAAGFDQYDWESYWAELRGAAAGGATTLDIATVFAASSDPVRRHVAIDLAGIIATGHPQLSDRVAGVVLASLGASDDAMFVASAANALAATKSAKGVPFLVGCLDSDVPPVRVAAVVALIATIDESPISHNALVRATIDQDAEVRFWATFGLAMKTDADTTTLRNALAGRLFDADTRVREEAIRGLAKRGDERARKPLEQARDGADLSVPIEMAIEFIDDH